MDALNLGRILSVKKICPKSSVHFRKLANLSASLRVHVGLGGEWDAWGELSKPYLHWACVGYCLLRFIIQIPW